MTGSGEINTDVPDCDFWGVHVHANVYPDAYGPPLTGNIFFAVSGLIDFPSFTVFGSWGSPLGADSYQSGIGWLSATGLYWSAYYSGDSVYLPSSASGFASMPSGCRQIVGFSAGPALTPAPKIQVHAPTAPGKGPSAFVLSSTPAKSKAF
jgi:hypothetical protein